MPEPEPNRKNFVLTAPPGGQFQKTSQFRGRETKLYKNVPVNMKNKINVTLQVFLTSGNI